MIRLLEMRDFVGFLFSVSKSENPLEIIMVAGILLVVAQIGNWFSALTITWLTLMWCFTYPKLYTEKQQQIDSLFEEASKRYKLQVEPALQKIPGYSKLTANYVVDKEKKTQ